MSQRNHPERGAISGLPFLIILFAAVVIPLTTACQFSQPSNASSSPKLLVLDPVDPISANADLLALLIRPATSYTTIRIDLLDLSTESNPSFQILLDTFPGGSIEEEDDFTGEGRWDASIWVSSDGSLSVQAADPKIQSGEIMLHVDPTLDILEVDLPQPILLPPGPFALAVASFEPDSSTIADTLGPVWSDAPALEPLRVLLAFNNVFPAETPAQALRSWDGAHNGPAGERFGLRHLLAPVELYSIPVVLADLRRPTSMLGLQLLGADRWIQKLEKEGLVQLPDALPYTLCEELAALAWPSDLQALMRSEASSLGYPRAKMLTCSGNGRGSRITHLPDGYQSIILDMDAQFSASGQPYSDGDVSVLRWAESPAASAPGHDGGPSIELRRLLAPGLSQSGGILVVEADFQRSFWGEPKTASDTLRWIHAHPWIHPISIDSAWLTHLPLLYPKETIEITLEGSIYQPEIAPIPLADVLPFLHADSSEGLRNFAWKLLYNSHASPKCSFHPGEVISLDDDHSECSAFQQALRTGMTYLAVVQRWEQTRNTTSEPIRVEDLKLDLESTIHVSREWLAILSPAGDQLGALFFSDPVKGSMPLIWSPGTSTQPDPHHPIEVTIHPSAPSLELTWPPRSPWQPFELPIYLPARFIQHQTECVRILHDQQSLTLGCSGEVQVQIELLEGGWGFHSFLDSPGRWDSTEDPNQEMPAGHFLPFSYGTLTFQEDSPAAIRISLVGS